jgi:serine/threonine protein kinase
MGRTLTQELRLQKLAEAETIAIGREILTGLVEVHTSNIIHRDLKPDNIIRRSHDHKLVLIDFGAVKAVLDIHPQVLECQTLTIDRYWYRSIYAHRTGDGLSQHRQRYLCHWCDCLAMFDRNTSDRIIR